MNSGKAVEMRPKRQMNTAHQLTYKDDSSSDGDYLYKPQPQRRRRRHIRRGGGGGRPRKQSQQEAAAHPQQQQKQKIINDKAPIQISPDLDESSSGSDPEEYDDEEICRSIISSKDEIRKCVECPVCLRIIRKCSIVMECHHRFCKECIDNSIRIGNKKCPSCRAHCPTKRSLRYDHNFDALVQALFPGDEKCEDEHEASFSELITWGRGGSRSHSRHGRVSRIPELVDYSQSEQKSGDQMLGYAKKKFDA